MRFLLSSTLMAAAFLGDQKCKEDSEHHRLPSQGVSRGNGLFFSNYHNTGAALNLGEENPKAVTAVALALTLFGSALYLGTFGKNGNGLRRAGYACVLGGAYSNLYDRMKRGYVVDYIALTEPKLLKKDVHGNPVKEVIFNLADVCVVLGTLVLAVSAQSGDGE